jgi:hypothetical protein
MRTFTVKQLADFRRFRKLQRTGRYNMASPAAAAALGLTKEEHLFVIENYDALEKQCTLEGIK